MCLLLGNSYMEKSDYERAIQSFERARIQTRHLTNQSLLVVSLVSFLTVILRHVEISHPPYYQMSGWNFDDFDITIRQRLCEALYTAGRTKEASESLLKMVDTFDQEVYASGPITEWVSGEFMYHSFDYHAFEFLPQISPTDVCPLSNARVLHSRWIPHTIEYRCLKQCSIRSFPHHS